MIEDFNIRWGQMVSYSSVTKRSKGHRQTGVSTCSFWAMVLDSRTKKKLSKILSECDCNRLWKDLTDAVLFIARENNNMEKENGGEDNSNSILPSACRRRVLIGPGIRSESGVIRSNFNNILNYNIYNYKCCLHYISYSPFQGLSNAPAFTCIQRSSGLKRAE
jgi:hypothetical protein